jgi:tRNA(Ile)-lysidine synthase
VISLDHSVVRTVRLSLDRLHCTDRTILCAVSGGLDSMAMLHMIAAVRDELRCSPIVVHVHHGLRGIASDDDERFVVGMADALGLPCVSKRVDVMQHAHTHGMSIEEAARHLRLGAFEAVALEEGAQVVCTAHTMDDQAETLLLHLARGSGLHGLSAMPPSRTLKSGLVLARPLLEVRRSELLDLAQTEQWTWREDASNDDVTFLRNAVRKNVMPVLRDVFGAGITSSIATSTALLRESRDIVDGVVRDHVARTIVVDGATTRLHVDVLAALPPSLRHEVIRVALRHALGEVADRTMVQRVDDLLQAETGSKASLRSTLVAVREREQIVLVDAEATPAVESIEIDHDGVYMNGAQTLTIRTASALDVRLDADRSVAYIDARSLVGPLNWRPWRAGERMRPFGMDADVLVSDLLTNAKVDHRHRSSATVLSDAQGIVWLCGIRLSDRVKVQSTTQHVTVCRIS